MSGIFPPGASIAAQSLRPACAMPTCALCPLAVLLGLAALVWGMAVAGWSTLLYIVLPYTACLTGIAGCAARFWRWAATPVPFPIAVSGGQCGSPDAPATRPGATIRLALETIAFRSLLRHTTAAETAVCGTPVPASVPGSPATRPIFRISPCLWALALGFHVCLGIVVLRHLGLWLEPVPSWLRHVDALDSLLQAGSPAVRLSGPVLAVCLTGLLARRLTGPILRRIALPADFFILYLLLALPLSGLALRHVWRPDLLDIKQHLLNLARFTPDAALAASLPPLFAVHLILACLLFALMPFSRLLHGPGLLLTPTRTLPCATRRYRYGKGLPETATPALFRSYSAYEDAFQDVMREACLPLDTTPPRSGEAGQ